MPKIVKMIKQKHGNVAPEDYKNSRIDDAEL